MESANIIKVRVVVDPIFASNTVNHRFNRSRRVQRNSLFLFAASSISGLFNCNLTLYLKLWDQCIGFNEKHNRWKFEVLDVEKMLQSFNTYMTETPSGIGCGTADNPWYVQFTRIQILEQAHTLHMSEATWTSKNNLIHSTNAKSNSHWRNIFSIANSSAKQTNTKYQKLLVFLSCCKFFRR